MISLDITNLKYNIILGIAWLFTHNPIMDWRTRVLKFPQCNHGTKTEGRSPLKVSIIRIIWMQSQGRALTNINEELPSEY